jgi:propanol-preferring alcohol dehydrogenase
MGTFAEYIAVWERALVKLPDSLSDQEVGLACGGITAYGAIKKLSNFGILPGQPIAVIGAAGGLGHYAVQIANAFGYEVIGVDIGHERLDFIRSLGAVVATDPDNALGFVHEMYGGVDASVVFATKISAFQLGFKMLAPGGLMVCVGIPGTSEGKIELSPMTFSRKEATITYSSAGTVEDMRQLMCLAQAGRVRSHVSRVSSLSDLPTIFDELEKAQYLGRAVLTNLSG